jgi:hypothetical protein
VLILVCEQSLIVGFDVELLPIEEREVQGLSPDRPSDALRPAALGRGDLPAPVSTESVAWMLGKGRLTTPNRWAASL